MSGDNRKYKMIRDKRKGKSYQQSVSEDMTFCISEQAGLAKCLKRGVNADIGDKAGREYPPYADNP